MQNGVIFLQPNGICLLKRVNRDLGNQGTRLVVYSLHPAPTHPVARPLRRPASAARRSAWPSGWPWGRPRPERRPRARAERRTRCWCGWASATPPSCPSSCPSCRTAPTAPPAVRAEGRTRTRPEKCGVQLEIECFCLLNYNNYFMRMLLGF